MYGIYANIWGILMVNVTTYSIHGSMGIYVNLPRGYPPPHVNFVPRETVSHFHLISSLASPLTPPVHPEAAVGGSNTNAEPANEGHRDLALEVLDITTPRRHQRQAFPTILTCLTCLCLLFLGLT